MRNQIQNWVKKFKETKINKMIIKMRQKSPSNKKKRKRQFKRSRLRRKKSFKHTQNFISMLKKEIIKEEVGFQHHLNSDPHTISVLFQRSQFMSGKVIQKESRLSSFSLPMAIFYYLVVWTLLLNYGLLLAIKKWLEPIGAILKLLEIFVLKMEDIILLARDMIKLLIIGIPSPEKLFHRLK